MKKEPLLFTPGPLTTSKRTKKSMLIDYGSWDDDFNEITNKIRSKLVKIVNGNNTYTCTPIQGSGSFGVEAMFINFVKKNEKILILINGAYGERIKKICNYHKIKNASFKWKEDEPLNLTILEKRLKTDPSIKNLAFVHCETSTGILNPINEVSKLCKKYKINLLIDAMSTFGAIQIDAKKIKFKALAASSNKCIEGVPGMAFVISKISDLKGSRGNSDNLCMDLYDQWDYMQRTGRWRYTPPTHVAVAFLEALNQFEKEGGLISRNKKYSNNLDALLTGMKSLGFKSLLAKKDQSPIIVTFIAPQSKKFNFKNFYQFLKNRGYIIYPGKMSKIDSFRIGCIGQINPNIIRKLVKVIEIFIVKNKININ